MNTKKTITANEIFEKDYPSIELAYPIAVSSYENLSKRNDAIDGKIQNSLTVAVSFFVAVVTLAKIKELDFASDLFVTASAFIIISVSFNLYSRIYGSLKTLDPAVFYDRWLYKDQIKFQKDLIYFAGEHYRHNNRVILIKWVLHVASIAAFLLTVTFLVLWVSRPF